MFFPICELLLTKNGTNRNQTIEKTVPDVKGSSCPYEIGTVMFRQCK